MKFKNITWCVSLALVQAVLTFNCGQSTPNNSETSTNDISIAITPGTSVVAPNQSQQFSAQITGVRSPDVVWGILNPSPDKGTINSSGLYTAPSTPPASSVTIVVQIVGHPAKIAMATVWFARPGTVSTTSNPMVAQYSIVVPDGGKVKIEFGPDTFYGLNTWTRNAPSGGGMVNILVAGMRMSSAYHMRAIIDLPGGVQMEDVDHTFQTGAPPASLIPQITVTPTAGMTPSGGVE
ncbi:MAG TPA: hypothetical protein VFL79_11065, partial [Terriglobia bacterium]|nr:hypothetical protein [Terriglobia bacterium]